MQYILENNYCINLRTRPDKRELAALEFARNGISIEWHRPTPDGEGGRTGCWRSHRWCLERIAAGPFAWGVIFEDDVTFDNFAESRAAICRFQTEYRGDILQFGGTVMSYIHESRIPGIWRAAVNQTHAYMISQSASRRILDDVTFTPTGTREGVDDWYRQNTKMYVLTRQSCWQRPGNSDIQWHANPWFQRVFQHPRVYLAFQRWSNAAAWALRWLPARVQSRVNPIPAILQLNDWWSSR